MAYQLSFGLGKVDIRTSLVISNGVHERKFVSPQRNLYQRKLYKREEKSYKKKKGEFFRLIKMGEYCIY